MPACFFWVKASLTGPKHSPVWSLGHVVLCAECLLAIGSFVLLPERVEGWVIYPGIPLIVDLELLVCNKQAITVLVLGGNLITLEPVGQFCDEPHHLRMPGNIFHGEA